jgi:hypothetical protein
MLKTVYEGSEMIKTKNWLHISGNENLLKQLPAGNWIGGTIEYFMTTDGGVTTDEKLYVNELDFSPIKVSVYDADNIHTITTDAYDNGFSVVLMPFGSNVLDVYAKNAPNFEDMFVKSIVGWVTGTNFAKPTTPFVINGQDLSVYTDKAVVIHASLPKERTANIGIINIFTANENSPVVEFTSNGCFIETCLIDGKEMRLSEYLSIKNIDTKIPMVGAFYNAELNASFFSVDHEKGIVHFATPVFPGIKYRFANPVADYPATFNKALKQFCNETAVFSCNCAYNYLYGELEGKHLDCFNGPATFGEIAYQHLNQTLVYLTIV